VLYELLTGKKHKHQGGEVLEELQQKLANTPRNNELIKVIRRSIRANPAQRYATAQEFKIALEASQELSDEVEEEVSDEELHRQDMIECSRKKLQELVSVAKQLAPKYNLNSERISLNEITRNLELDLFEDGQTIDELTPHYILTEVFNGKTNWMRTKEYTKNVVKNVWNKTDPIIDGVVDKLGKAGIVAGKYLWGKGGRLARGVVQKAYAGLLKNVNRDVPLSVPSVVYKDFLVEMKAERAAGQVVKSLMYYDASLADLRSKGFARHFRPQEVFGLLADSLEGKLTGELKGVADDMLSSYGEWLSLAFERDGDRLVCYVDPEGLIWKDGRYVKDANFKFAEKKVFDVSGKSSNQWIDLSNFGDDFVRFLYGRSFSDLPVKMREGGLRAQVYLPPDKTAWPVGCGNFVVRFDVDGFSYYSRASRGLVPVVQKKLELFSSLYNRAKDVTYNRLIKDMARRSETVRLAKAGLGLFGKLLALFTPAEKVALLENEDYKVLNGSVTANSENITDASLTVPAVVYTNFLVERNAKRDAGQVDKSLMSYDASLANLRSEGFARHARPQEAFGLLADGLEGKLSGALKVVYDDMLAGYGEWLSLAFEREGDRLVCYLDPEGLVWGDGRYVKDSNFKFAEKKVFDVSGKSSNQWIGLGEFGDDFVRFLYGRSFSDLPVQMREGYQRARVYLPSDKIAWPVGRGDFVRFDVCGFGYYGGASRGVHVVQNFFS
ncbi:MAG: hypothetical protein HY363_03955, partial [Candidatus Aenigmarchaeota archaeon]|nr:hypothetical protein [Candidatus Aenigmarchaeota archaeon]